MKKFVVADIEALDLNETAFGLYNKEIPDSEKTFKFVEEEGGWGWVQEFGETSK